MWAKLESLQWQADVLAFVVGLGSLLISSYIAILLSRLSRRFSQNEAIRSINESWDSFHNAMLNKEVHDLFWSFVRSAEPFTGLGDRAHHIVLMYINNVHTEYHTYKNQIFSDYDQKYIDTLLKVLVPQREKVLMLAEASGYDEEYIKFMRNRLEAMNGEGVESARKGVALGV